MAKYKPHSSPAPDSERQALKQPSQKSSDTFIRVGILVGVALLVVISGMNLYQTRQQRIELNQQMAQLATSINTKPAAPAAHRTRSRQGLYGEDRGSSVCWSWRRANHDCRVLGVPMTVLREGRSDS
jgi:uncharacterized protein HemX